ncbi:MAG: hypothetical protein LKF53_04985 [Solobacterium sp.]|jgi:hypothetical protein|nr:hypothetical protein [Solobacterium sp.]MCH4205729.1 hypothetical protein [Solobacterium sp.]MCH4227253.1 hypothetical protein [Solobacterium sp.]MCH4282559.1 hypothetical protein [Solobacterium sp.]
MKIEKKKNPGREQREAEKEANDTKRGAKIPLNKVVEDKKAKQKKRSRLKADLQKEVKDEE